MPISAAASAPDPSVAKVNCFVWMAARFGRISLLYTLAMGASSLTFLLARSLPKSGGLVIADDLSSE